MTLLADGEVVALGTAALSLISTITLAFIGYLTQKMKIQAELAAKRADEAAVKVGEVKTTLVESTAITDAKLDEGLKINKATHTLVNNNMMLALTESRDDKRRAVADKERIATLSNGNAYAVEAVAAAKHALDVSQKLLDEHIAKQQAVDAEYGKDAKMGTVH